MTLIPYFAETERKILAEGKTETPIIAIGGWAGTGKDTAAKNLQTLLEKRDGIKIELHVAGDIFRAAAREAGYNEQRLDEFSASVKGDELDKRVDGTTLRMALAQGGIYVGRLAPAVIGESGITVWMETDPKAIAERISRDPERKEYGLPIDELADRIEARNKADASRYERIYGTNPEALKTRCGLVLNNSKLTKEETAEALYKFVRPRLKL